MPENERPKAHSLDDEYLIEGPQWAQDLARPRKLRIVIPMALVAALIGVAVWFG